MSELEGGVIEKEAFNITPYVFFLFGNTEDAHLSGIPITNDGVSRIYE